MIQPDDPFPHPLQTICQVELLPDTLPVTFPHPFALFTLFCLSFFRYRKPGGSLVVGGESLVLLSVHEGLDLLDALLVDLDLCDPAAAVGVVLGDLVDGAGLLLEAGVDLGDLAGDGGVDVGGALDGLDGADGIALGDGGALLGELDVDDVAQLLGGVLGNADDARLLVGVEVDPLVVLGVLAY